MEKRIYNEETIKNIGKEISISGWVDTIRSHGKILFIDLRDKSGILQVVVSPQQEDVYDFAKEIRPEWVVAISGVVKERPERMQNPNLATGKIELEAQKIDVFLMQRHCLLPLIATVMK